MNTFSKLLFSTILFLVSSATFAKPMVGDLAPSITANAIDNSAIDTQVIGKHGLEIVFLDSLCPMPHFPDCEAKIERLKQDIKRHPKRQWIGVMNSYYVDTKHAANWLKTYAIGIPVVFDNQNRIFTEYGVYATPYRVSVSNRGKITDRGPVK